MVSDLFMKDWRAMTAAGVAFTPEDIVRLNALAVKVKLTKNPISAVTLPRACFLGDIVLRELADGEAHDDLAAGHVGRDGVAVHLRRADGAGDLRAAPREFARRCLGLSLPYVVGEFERTEQELGDLVRREREFRDGERVRVVGTRRVLDLLRRRRKRRFGAGGRTS